jgi:hypothetical protein
MTNPTEAAKRAAEKIINKTGELQVVGCWRMEAPPTITAIIDAEFAPIIKEKDDKIAKLECEISGLVNGTP